MFSQELLGILKQVITSWQVIAMTCVIIIYWMLVNSVTNPRKKIPKASVVRHKKLKRPPAAPKLDKNIDASGIGIGD
jgi:hypothetical protein